VTVEQAPAHSQEVLKKYGRPEYAKLLADRPHVLPLNASAMVAAFRKWDTEVGAQKTK
jgi:putative spermidine/putrescine transport system substrate-binding protein